NVTCALVHFCLCKPFQQQLSESRAAAVKNVLIQRGIDPKRIRSVGFGESQPISTSNAVNRRVTLRIIPLVDGSIT
ncbi:MAG: OmpA family protein, partial [Desulfobacterales bacterium]